MINQLVTITCDVLCIGHASYDLVFAVDHHPGSDEKVFAQTLLDCGGGPAANAAVCAAKLGVKAAFSGYLGRDFYGDKHVQELQQHGVNTQLVVRDAYPTPLSAVIVKPDGQRALINYKGDTKALPAAAIDFSAVQAKVVLFDGHEPNVSLQLLASSASKNYVTVLDAGSAHEGTLALMSKVDYLLVSEKFARHFHDDMPTALNRLGEKAPAVAITLSERGLLWRKGDVQGVLPAYSVNTIDSTGAGDAFHGAFSAAIAKGMDWLPALRYASAAGALCCTKMGARPGLPDEAELHALLATTSI